MDLGTAILYIIYYNMTICQTRKFFTLNQKKSEQEFHLPEDHECPPDQENQGLQVDLLCRYSHPLLENQAHHLLLDVPEHCSYGITVV